MAAIAEKAKAKLPECNGRVDKAVALVLNGDVELLPDGNAKVASQSNGTTAVPCQRRRATARTCEGAEQLVQTSPRAQRLPGGRRS